MRGSLRKSKYLTAWNKWKTTGAAPGSDGITVEFLKVYWSHLEKVITASFNSAFEKGHISSSHCKAVITLTHKGKDLPQNQLKNWRPIYLINSDYKLLAKCLALRLSRAICDRVNIDQVGYIRGRRLSTLLRLVDDIIDQQNVFNEPDLLVTMEYFHAFGLSPRRLW